MPEGLAKTAEQAQPVPETIHPEEKPQVTSASWEGIPIEIYRYFDIDIGKVSQDEIKQFQDIYKWAKLENESATLGDILLKIRDLEHTLGATNFGETRHGKIWNWAKLTLVINEMNKRREALRRK